MLHSARLFSIVFRLAAQTTVEMPNQYWPWSRSLVGPMVFDTDSQTDVYVSQPFCPVNPKTWQPLGFRGQWRRASLGSDSLIGLSDRVFFYHCNFFPMKIQTFILHLSKNYVDALFEMMMFFFFKLLFIPSLIFWFAIYISFFFTMCWIY